MSLFHLCNERCNFLVHAGDDLLLLLAELTNIGDGLGYGAADALQDL